ncbi:hypothetical protein VKT23_015575 [Stygiomarasmius scandens]|uniref:Uncharacterized protein n=1 Tax=Marasmiellus scandens TaxID=2682957 RepID=A0ABR1IXD8_9AGAR
MRARRGQRQGVGVRVGIEGGVEVEVVLGTPEYPRIMTVTVTGMNGQVGHVSPGQDLLRSTLVLLEGIRGVFGRDHLIETVEADTGIIGPNARARRLNERYL